MPVLSTSMNNSLGPAVCRVCLCSETSIPYLGNAPGEPLISPCHCKGTMGLYHRSCLEHWLSTSRTYCCEICKFRYEIGRRKQGFLSYLRAHSWFIDGDHTRSLGSDCACLLVLTPITIGGSVLCIQHINERLRMVDENGDFEKAHEILGLGLMAFFLIVVFCFWILFTVLFYVHDFRVWQRKNVILYVIDQLDREDEAYSRTHNHFSESQRPLLLRKKIRKLICCGGRSREDTIIPLRDTAIIPLMVQSHGGIGQDVGSSHARQHRAASTTVRTSSSSQRTNAGRTPQAAISGPLTSQITEGANAVTSSPQTEQQASPSNASVPVLSTFRPHVTSSSALMFPYTSTPRLLLPMSTMGQSSNTRIGVRSPSEDVESTTSVPPEADGYRFSLISETMVVACQKTSPQFETPL